MSELAKKISELPPEKRKLLLEKLKKKNEVPDDKIVSVNRDASNAFSLSFAQERLWFLDQLDPGGFAYNLPLTVRIFGELNILALGQAINEIVRRHEILRTKLLTRLGRPVQVVDPELRIEIPVVDLSTTPDPNAELQRLAVEEAETPFDLASGPLLRARLLKLDDQEFMLLLTMQHIVTDAWSLGLFFNELAEFYKQCTVGTTTPLPQLAIQYIDYAVWEREQLQGARLEQKLSYWLKQLAAMPSHLELPLDYPRPAVQTSRGSVEFFKLPPTLSKRIKEISLSEGTTLSMTLLAVFKILLHRYTGQDDIVVGTAVANRYRPELENLIGFFINNLILRTDLSRNPTFRELLHRVKQVTLDAYSHSDIPFSKLVEVIQPLRDLSSSPLFDVMFVFQNAPMQEMQLEGLRLNLEVKGNYRISRFDVTLYMGEEEDGLGGAIEYNLDLFEAETIKRMVSHLRVLLERVTENPDLPIATLSLLNEAERHKLLVEWNDTKKVSSMQQCFHQLFEAKVEEIPEKTALVCELASVTYAGLNERANQLAHYLRRLGAGKETLIGVCLEPSVEMLVALLGTLKAGAAYVPLDPSYPRQRLDFMAKDADIAILLTQKSLAEVVSDVKMQVVYLDSDWHEIEQETTENPHTTISPANLAYVIYTSGSTGKPKGVAVAHAALTNFLGAMHQRPGLTDLDIMLAVTTLSFDIAALELYLPLLAGGRIDLASREVTGDGKLLIERITKSGATVMQATPATWRMLFEAGWQGNRQLKVFSGGEALSNELAERLHEKVGSLWNLYGPTETTVWSAVHQVQSLERHISIGRPIDNTEIYLLDKNYQPIPVGVLGELYIGGAGLARGYLKRPDLTAERFVPNPFSREPGARLYRTGDLARYQSDGSLDCLGRIDHQVKLRGFRIELGEIEATLASHAAIEQVVALAVEIEPAATASLSNAEQDLVAYLVVKGKEKPTTSELRAFLIDTLPVYMVPSIFIFLEKIPLTPNGKVSRRDLPLPEGNRPVLESEYVEPQNDMERQIADVWQKVLRMEGVGVNDNFFSLGGHSLLLVQVQGKLTELFDKTLSILELFRHPTIRALAKYIDESQPKDVDFSRIHSMAEKRKNAIQRRKNLRSPGSPLSDKK